MKKTTKCVSILLIIYLTEAVLSGIHPVDRTIWFSENVIAWIIIGIFLDLWCKGIRFSNIAYLLITFYLCWHTVGGHYTFEKVPFDWVINLIGAERNHFDRVSHFSVGFLALPII